MEITEKTPKEDSWESTWNKLIQIYNDIESNITKRMTHCRIVPRPCPTNGLWCCLLLPAVLLIYSTFYQVSVIYRVTAYVSSSLLVHSILTVLFMSISTLPSISSMNSGFVACGLISTLQIYCFAGQGLLVSLVLSLPATYAHLALLKFMLINCPKTFTLGEAIIMSQGIVVFAVNALSRVLLDHEEIPKELDLVNTVIYTIFFGLSLLLVLLASLRPRSPWRRALRLAAPVGALTAGALHAALGPTALLQLLAFVCHSRLRLFLIGYWLSLVVIAVVVVRRRVGSARKADTGARKAFHALATLVLLPGALLDAECTRLAAAAALAVIVLIEALRKAEIEPMSSHLNLAFDLYCDEKDQGTFAMTPLYLLLGLAAPLALVPAGAAPLERLGGALAVGVGDSAASLVGSRWGRVPCADTGKTLEGVIANAASQVVTVYALQAVGLLSSPHCVARAGVAAALSAAAEGRLRHVDNLVLPLLAALGLQLTCFLCGVTDRET